MGVIKIVLADDHPIVRGALQSMLEAAGGFQVIGAAGDALQAAQLVEQLKPDILVLDLVMPGLNGLEIIQDICRHTPQTRVVVFSMHANETYVLEALQAGAAAYVLKQSPPDELIRAVREAVAGRHYLSPPLSEQAIKTYTEKARAGSADPYQMLTSRERQVLQLAAQGLTSAQIGEQLLIGTRTVETHRANLMHKLGLHTPAELVRYALQRQIVPDED